MAGLNYIGMDGHDVVASLAKSNSWTVGENDNRSGIFSLLKGVFVSTRCGDMEIHLLFPKLGLKFI